MKIKTKIAGCHTADSKPVKQEINGTVILPPLVFPGAGVGHNEKQAGQQSAKTKPTSKANVAALTTNIFASVTNRVTRMGDFSPIGLLLEDYYDFLKRRRSP